MTFEGKEKRGKELIPSGSKAKKGVGAPSEVLRQGLMKGEDVRVARTVLKKESNRGSKNLKGAISETCRHGGAGVGGQKNGETSFISVLEPRIMPDPGTFHPTWGGEEQGKTEGPLL